MKPTTAPKLPTINSGGPNREAKSQQAQEARHLQQLKSLAQGRCLESLVLERLRLPKQVVEFNQFEELSKLYQIEQPHVARTRVELLFDVYDGRRLERGLFGSLENDDEAGGEVPAANGEQQQQGFTTTTTNSTIQDKIQQDDENTTAATATATAAAHRERSKASFLSAARRKSSFRDGAREAQSAGGGHLSWCKLLFARLHGKQRQQRQINGSRSPFKCCLKPSDTNQELGLISVSTSGQSLSGCAGQQSRSVLPVSADQMDNSAVAAAHRALVPKPDDQPEESELKLEALRVIASALATSTRRPIDLITQTLGVDSSCLGPALAMESAQMESTGGCVSVCLLDKRQLTRASKYPMNGRRWARASAKLVQLRRKLRCSGSRSVLSMKSSGAIKKFGRGRAAAASSELSKQLDRIARKVSRKFWSELAQDELARLGSHDDDHHHHRHNDQALEQSKGDDSKEAKLDTEQVEQLIELVKGSLNQLIDAQLLLRNKLTGLDQLSGSAIVNQVRSAEYENLLRNNFNLLKIWQNLEETQNGRLVCFVCEPIKANLADLFWFNRQRLDWAPAEAFESTNLNSNTMPSNGGCGGGQGRCLLFSSPLVCLDSGQVKRGLLQILEALNFLHGICKLIHRNLNPKNILICQNDNWKLSGLEFAVRFESTTISESASMMAHEFGQIRYTLQAASSHHSSAALSSGGGSGAGGTQLRRQRTLHQTRCQEFATNAKSLLLQPDLDYLAPEILRHAKCSHKSDLFSFGLILGQTYDLCRHKAPISCRSQVQQYDAQLKKLNERRKSKLAQLVPIEMRPVFCEMLESEPNLRPSANRVLQLLKRPIELCKSSEDSLRHLKSSLDHLDRRLTGGTGLTNNNSGSLAQQQQTNNSNSNQAGGLQDFDATNGNTNATNINANANQTQTRARARGYFSRVTSAAAQRTPNRKQTKSLQLLNYFVQAIESIALSSVASRQALLNVNNQDQQQHSSAGGGGDFFADHHQAGQQHQQQQSQHPPGGRRLSFCSQRIQFEQTLETLKQVFKSTATQASEIVASSWVAGAGVGPELLPTTAAAATTTTNCSSSNCTCPVDSRSLLLIVALHRRLLDQVGQLRAELPPICRLIAPSSSSSQQPLDRSLPSANHRALADLEERLYLIISKHSLARLGETLADPLLKLEEFLLVFELVNDLVCFVGQKCKQNYAQRGKQLLNELTPVTGCPLLSSSEEEDDEDDLEPALGLNRGYTQTFGGSTLALAMQHQNTGTSAGPLVGGGGGGGQARGPLKRLSQQGPFRAAAGVVQNDASRPTHMRQQQRQANYNLPTSINITAPSPMGSVRDVSRLSHQQGDSPVDSKLFSTVGGASQHSLIQQQATDTSSSRCSSPMKRHSHQDVLADQYQLIDKTSQMCLGGGGGVNSASRRSIANCLLNQTQQQQQPPTCDSNASSDPNRQAHQEAEPNPTDDKSRSELIDELLKTINDDSFNEFIDFNNKLTAAATAAATNTTSQPDQMNSGTGSSASGAMMDLVNANRPKSAIGDGAGRYSSNQQVAGRQSSCSPTANANATAAAAAAAAAAVGSARPPRTLNLATNQTSASGGYQSRGSICVTPSSHQQASTFDNVIRRMSTNFVQNFNKMSASTLGTANNNNDSNTNTNTNTNRQGDFSGTNQQHSESSMSTATSATTLRREKSSTSNYANSSTLYVDNQVPARRHSDNTINVPRIQVALSSPSSSGSRTNLNQRASVSASKLANKWKLTAKSNQREASDKLSPNLGGALGYIRRHSSGNTQGGGGGGTHHHSNNSEQNQSNGLGAQLLNASPFKTRSNSNLGIDFLMSNRSMKRRYSTASMLGHQTQRKAEDLIDAGMKSVQNMFS